MSKEDSEIVELISGIESIDGLLAMMKNNASQVYDGFTREQLGFAQRKLRDKLISIDSDANSLNDALFIERIIEPAKPLVKQKYYELVNAERFKNSQPVSKPKLNPLNWDNVSTPHELVSRYDQFCTINSIKDDEKEVTKEWINRYLSRPHLTTKILDKDFDWDSSGIPHHFGLRMEIRRIARLVHEHNISALWNRIETAQSAQALGNIFVENSIFIDQLDVFGSSAQISSDIIHLMGDVETVAKLHDGKPINWEAFPSLARNPTLQLKLSQLATDFERKRRQTFRENIQAANNFQQLIQAIEQYEGYFSRHDTIKNINEFISHKKNLLYLAQAKENNQEIDWEHANIPHEFGITDKIAEIAFQQVTPQAKPPSERSIHVTDEEWERVAALFAADPDKIKLDKKIHNLSHSFIKIGDEIYALQNKDCLGEGNFGIVKLVVNQSGQQFAVKIEGTGEAADNQAERDIMEIVGFYLGEAERAYGKEFKGRFSEQKRYRLMKLLEGHELHDHLYFGYRQTKKQLDVTSRMMIAIKAAEAVQFLHDHRIVHCDIKPENFMMNVYGDQITISSFDFGFSMKLPPDKESIFDKPKGSDFYLAPEIEIPKYSAPPGKGEYSFATDVFSLGRMFEHDLDLGNVDFLIGILEKMTAEVRQDRPTLPDVLNALYAAHTQLISTPSQAVEEAAKQRAKPIIVRHKSILSSESSPVAEKEALTLKKSRKSL